MMSLLVKLRGLSDLSSFTHVAQARRQGRVRSVRSHPPRAEKVRLERAKDKRKERQRWIFPSNLPMNECRKHIRGCWSLNITLHVIDQYLSRPINGPNTIVRKGPLAVVFLDSVFSKNTETPFSYKISPKHLYTYLNCSYLTYSFSNNTHCLLFLPHLVTELKITTSGSVQNEERCVRVDQPIFWKIRKKYWKIYTNHNPFIRRKVVPSWSVTLTAEPTLSSVCMTKTLPRLTELTAGWSHFWIHTDLYVASSIQ